MGRKLTEEEFDRLMERRKNDHRYDEAFAALAGNHDKIEEFEKADKNNTDDNN